MHPLVPCQRNPASLDRKRRLLALAAGQASSKTSRGAWGFKQMPGMGLE